MTFDHIARNLDSVRRRMADAALRAGRDPADVTLVAVTKQRTDDEVRALVAAGQRLLAESHPQALVSRSGRLAPEAPLTWHLIGHLQTNKVKTVVGRCALIHGVDNANLLHTLNRAAAAAELERIDVLLEVNVSGEESKFGFTPASVEEAIAALAPLGHVRCLGLMTMAPFEARPEDTRPVFRALRELRDRLAQAGAPNFEPRHLSMGMTNDFEVAVEEGATLVRVGTALFQ
jgi:pyridoxal phosphate enzyme (YggS family)